LGLGQRTPEGTYHSVRLLKRAVRQPDPHYSVEEDWVVRRIGPHCGRIELTDIPKKRDERHLLKAMGYETANLHLATSGQRKNVLRDLTKRKPDWLLEAAKAMA
jgi:hypothetical protein